MRQAKWMELTNQQLIDEIKRRKKSAWMISGDGVEIMMRVMRELNEELQARNLSH